MARKLGMHICSMGERILRCGDGTGRRAHGADVRHRQLVNFLKQGG